MRGRDEILKPRPGRPTGLLLSLALIAMLAVGAPSAALARPSHHRRHHKHGHGLKVGQIVMSYADGDQACAEAVHADTGADAINIVKGDGPLLDNGIVLLSCGRGVFTKTTAVVGYDIFTHRTLWVKALAGVDTFATTQHRLLAVTKHRTPPSGLKGASTSWSITAFDLRTGRPEWTAPFPAEAPGEGFWGVWEEPLGPPGSPEGILVQYKGTQAYSTSGQLLWHEPQVHSTYVAAGIAEEYTHKGATFSEFTRTAGPQTGINGFNAQTGALAWSATLPQPCDLGEFTGRTPALVGTVLWAWGKWDDEEGHGGYCVVAHDVATGQVIADSLFPESLGDDFAADPEHLVAWSGGSLSGYATTDASHPIWSEPAGETEPLEVSGGHALVGARSGLLILSTATGAIEAHVPKEFLAEEGNNLSVTNGLVANFLQYGEVAVLDLDR